MKRAEDWQSYQILATGNGEKLEVWNGFKLLRPDPQAIWDTQKNLSGENGLHAKYVRESTGGGHWEVLKPMPEEWDIGYKDLTFRLKLMNFKHTGLFPEQAVNWDAMRALIAAANRPIKVLNLFAYTGAASAACAKEGAFVTHVDAAKGIVERAKTNCRISGVAADRVRWIVDDCGKFLTREIKRGGFYDAVIMDPPSYGRSPSGEVWKLENDLSRLTALAAQVLTDRPLFFLLNSYTTGLGAAVMQNVLNIALKELKGTAESYEICLPTQEEGIVLPCGNSAFWRGAV